MAKNTKVLKIKRVMLVKNLNILEKRIQDHKGQPSDLNRLKELLDNFIQIDAELTASDEGILDTDDILERIDNCITALDTPQNPTTTPSLGNIKLPQLNLPIFDGNYENWLEFYEAFNSLIHTNQGIQNVEKFHYLISCLKGTACDLITNLEITNENYLTAWDLLTKRYHSHKAIIDRYVTMLFNLPSVSKTTYTVLNLVDDVNKIIRALKSLGQPVEHWDTLLVHLIVSKLDSSSNYEWEKFNTEDELPQLDDLMKFLSKRASFLSTLNSSNKNKATKSAKVFVSTELQCPNCKGNHLIYRCESFKSLSIKERYELVRQRNLCSNCLHPGHMATKCASRKCTKCGKNHHTLLHNHREENSQSPERGGENNSVSAHCAVKMASGAILSTVRLRVRDQSGHYHECRALLDSGSQHNFMTLNIAKKLNLKLLPPHLSVSGLGQTNANVTGETQTIIQSLFSEYKISTEFIVLPIIVNRLPSVKLDRTHLNIPKNIKLADNHFDIPGDIDLLLGADIFWKALCVGQVKLGRGQPILQKTTFGWVLGGGTVNSKEHNRVSHCNLAIKNQLHDQVERFWLIEDIQQGPHFSTEEKECVRIFETSVHRDQDGRFTVDLPFKLTNKVLGESVSIAQKRFFQLEKKLNKNIDLRNKYNEFMREYIELGHMTEIQPSKSEHPNSYYYLPHHGVLREDSATTKLRVVFDGSAKTENGISLNDILLAGPKVQDDLFDIVIRFRKHQIVVTSDIEKMYRQVFINKNQRSYQRIIWRENPQDPIKHFELNTVTYGTTSAPFLAIQCLKKLASEHVQDFPLGSKIISNDFYVDDLVTGGSTEGEVRQLINEVQHLLSGAGFRLRKWASNFDSVLEGISSQGEAEKHLFVEGDITKTLGIIWNSTNDTLRFKIDFPIIEKRVTKRLILSQVAKIFDPLGLLSPVIITAKLLLQRLWQQNINWDESVPQEVHSDWKIFSTRLGRLRHLNIPRRVVAKNPQKIELHGFCDASEQAYGACIYIKTIDLQGNSSVHLLCSKSKVAPLKTVTLPRLELCGALLLAKLLYRVKEKINIEFNDIKCWCDSTITLTWIYGEPHLWQTFVANRVAEIQNLTTISQWGHVSGTENPADLITRGIHPDALMKSAFWWQGPQWLSQSSSPEKSWKQMEIKDIPDRAKPRVTTVIAINEEPQLLTKFSSFSTLQRVTAYMLRFVSNSKTRNKNDRLIGPLSRVELQGAIIRVVKVIQTREFDKIMKIIKNGQTGELPHNLSPLNPFIDDDGLLRVGGRLIHADLPFEKKHQLLLPRSHVFTKLLIEHLHIKYLHLGPNSLLNRLREQFWIVGGLNTIKRVIRKCLICFKANPKPGSCQMGNLPSVRVQPARPFTNSGVDLAGPFELKTSKLRNAKVLKCYVALFVCLSTKAVHLELVDSLTSQSFLNALKRFFARRGVSTNLYSDNATNFIGSKNIIDKTTIQRASEEDLFTWHFIPPNSPHFGGLWESLIKSVKFHLKRVIINTKLTHDEWTTLLSEIEACLNSRPLTNLNNDPNEALALTPGHFLIGGPLINPPIDTEPSIDNTRYELIAKLKRDYWKRWSREYLNKLQERKKWKVATPNIKIGTLVLVKDENLPPMQWRLGRILKTYEGTDKLVRVVDVKTNNGILKRSILKICPLPDQN